MFIEADEPSEIRILFRENAVKEVKVNSERIELRRENGYIAVERLFRNGDRIDIEIEASLQWVSLPGSEALAALMYGNVLIAKVGDDPHLNGITFRKLQEKFASRIQGGELEVFVEDEEGRQARFIPLYRVEEESYSVYLDWSGHAEPYRRFSFAADGSAAYEGVDR